MTSQRSVSTMSAAMLAVVLATPVAAQINVKQAELAQPDYSSGASTGFVANTNFNTPESDGRPGLKFYAEGMDAYHRGNINYALSRLKLAAFWGYAPAAYNLGVMYFQGEGGTPVNRPLGTAWMFIAAERGSQVYVDARHMLVSELDNGERAKAYQLLQGLQPKYGNKVAMRRAENQWQYTRANQTGTRVGGTVGELRIGVQAGGGAFHTPSVQGASMGGHLHSWMAVLSAGSVDGDMAYQQLQASNNPYDPAFIKNRTGKVTVAPLQQKKSGARQPEGRKPDSSPSPPSSSPRA